MLLILYILNITLSYFIRNKDNIICINNGKNITLSFSCGSGKKYKNCHGRPGHESDPIPEPVIADKPSKNKAKPATKKTTKKAKK